MAGVWVRDSASCLRLGYRRPLVPVLVTFLLVGHSLQEDGCRVMRQSRTERPRDRPAEVPCQRPHEHALKCNLQPRGSLHTTLVLVNSLTTPGFLILFLIKIYLFEREKKRVRARSSIHWFTPQGLQWPGLEVEQCHKGCRHCWRRLNLLHHSASPAILGF